MFISFKYLYKIKRINIKRNYQTTKPPNNKNMRYYSSKILTMLLALTGLPLFTACVDSDDVGENYKTFEGQTIKDFLSSDAQYSDFCQALDASGALSLMSSYGKYTCFVPNNDAVATYLAANGFTSLQQLLDSTSAVKEMVYYHIIDGESNGVGTYKTSAFTNSNIETKNMLGRYVYTSISPDGTSWILNNTTTITSPDNVMVNGVVHLVDKVLQGNNDLLATYLSNNPDFRLYAKAIAATGIADRLRPYEDDTYKQPESPISAKAPERRLYGFTALLETDSVLSLHGITTLDEMRTKAEQLYPQGRGLADNNPQSSLAQFVAYHFLNYKLTASQLCPMRDYTVTKTWEDPEWQTVTFRDGKFSLDNYLFPLTDNTVINVQKFVWRDQAEQTPVFNDSRNPYSPQYTNFISECPDAITIIPEKSNQDCLNGEVHALTSLLYYDESVYHKRIRMDFSSFLPELFNNDIFTISSSDNGRYIPLGYCENMKWDDKDGITCAYYVQFGGHSYNLGDVLIVSGRTNFEIEIGPVPSGSYEVRVGYHPRKRNVSVYPYGLVQYYLDGEPCGIPLDQSVIGVESTDIGWNQVYGYMAGYYEQNPIATLGAVGSWCSGRETVDDYFGYQNDKAMHNLGYMHAPDSYTSNELANGDTSQPIHAGTARNDGYSLRRVLKMVTWNKTEKHTLRISALEDAAFDLDFIEFIPKDLIEDEDTH